MEETYNYPEQILSSLYGTVMDPFSHSIAASSNPTSVNEWLMDARKEALKDTDIGRMIGALSAHSRHGGYVLPPEFDFMHRKEVAPFQMMVIPFNHVLHKQELVDIYQGIAPQSSLQDIICATC